MDEYMALFTDWDVDLIGKRITITPMQVADRDAYGSTLLGHLYQMMKDRGVEPDTEFDDILSHKTAYITSAIRLSENNVFIGYITLQRDEANRPDLGMSLLEPYRGHGYGPEAITLYCNHLHDAYGLSRIYVRVSDSTTTV